MYTARAISSSFPLKTKERISLQVQKCPDDLKGSDGQIQGQATLQQCRLPLMFVYVNVVQNSFEGQKKISVQ